jgi:hypothetical protein
MKKLILVSSLCFGLFSCSTDEVQPTQRTTHSVIIQNTGGSPQVFISRGCVTTKQVGSNVSIYAEKGDVITAIGLSYSTDNSNNYGGTNVNVTANIKIIVDGEVVKEGVNWIAYQIK